ncbi:hypothetical protein yc1106_02175 [Curvularia clavata]|uniref:Uncharacterized protein n=1 Tax=Curvularia clavata TaxID=95742 RepID=A0A9Q9DR07_CURCL|nr:hypothetical protein yc1106_02175 [Curvularia clavata]
MPTMRMPFTVSSSANAPRGLRILQSAQVAIAGQAIFACFVTVLLPFRHKLFTLSLLYTPLLTSITTVFFLVRERKHAEAGTLSKRRYAKYQALKMVAAIGMSIIGFIGYIASAPAEADQDKHYSGEQGMWLNGVKIGRWQSALLWLNFFNWVFLWASLFYSCCMTGNKQGAIALAGDEARLGVDTDNLDDEALARDLEAQDRH